MLAADRNRAFGRWLIIAILLFFAFQLADVGYDLQEPDQNALLIHIFSGTIAPVMSVTPVIAALPFATGFARDIRSGMAVSMLVRSGRKRFFLSKLACCALSGGIALAAGTLLYVIFINLWFSHNYGEFAEMIHHVAFYDFSAGVNLKSILGYYATVTVLQFMAGVFWASSALCFSAFVPNVSLTLCAPLLLYKLCEEINPLFPAWLSPYLLQTGNVGLPVWTTIGAGAMILLGGGCILGGIFLYRGNLRMTRS